MMRGFTICGATACTAGANGVAAHRRSVARGGRPERGRRRRFLGGDDPPSRREAREQEHREPAACSSATGQETRARELPARDSLVGSAPESAVRRQVASGSCWRLRRPSIRAWGFIGGVTACRRGSARDSDLAWLIVNGVEVTGECHPSAQVTRIHPRSVTNGATKKSSARAKFQSTRGSTVSNRRRGLFKHPTNSPLVWEIRRRQARAALAWAPRRIVAALRKLARNVPAGVADHAPCWSPGDRLGLSASGASAASTTRRARSPKRRSRRS
jgi:hypothetical protein